LVFGAAAGLLGPSPAAAKDGDDEADYYRIDAIDIPKEAFLEVGGLGYSPDGALYVSTRRGEIWTYRRGAAAASSGIPSPGASEKGTWSRFAQGLHEATGLLVVGNGEVLVAQRPELTRVRDTDRDGKADRFERITSAFGLTGNYHEYHFGPVRDRAGNLFATLNLAWEGRGVSWTPYRGWTYKVTPKGDFVPYATGLRSPSGIGLSPKGELFVTDNQGDWVATSALYHVREGGFYGHPAGLKWKAGYKGPEDPAELPDEELQRQRTLPAAWFPYGVAGHAPAEPTWDTSGGKFGPFPGQMLVGDQTKSFILRVALEKVQGEYQGVVFPFRRGFASGILRFAWDKDKSLIVGGTDRGWGATGGKVYALERLTFTGKTPFEVKTMSLTPSGFELSFTKPVDRTAAADPASYAFVHWGYKYWRTYGSPHVDSRGAPVRTAVVSPDGRKVTLTVPGLEAPRLWELKVRGLKAADGSPLLHDTAWYTLNRLRKERDRSEGSS
jgi:hypothetical protein